MQRSPFSIDEYSKIKQTKQILQYAKCSNLSISLFSHSITIFIPHFTLPHLQTQILSEDLSAILSPSGVMAKTLSLPEVAEMKIPVFTVLKNGAILKNVFIVNKSPEPEPLASSVLDHDRHDHILIVGRHPDCNIMLTHPSISRFHLQIQSNPCSQKLFVIDLSSVHGTWVSGRKIEPGMRVEMKEGDALRIGASSRLYRLHWIPISRAYDLENPFASELVMTVEAEKGQEDDALPEEEEEKDMTLVRIHAVMLYR